MAKNNNTERDRDVTEQRMLKAVGEMIRRDGFEKLGVNAVAAHCGVSKILIYRYFGSLDGLLAAYIRQHAKPGDLVITMGAGDVYQVGSMLLKGSK